MTLKILLTSTLIALPTIVQADSGSIYTATVTAVHDGDTIRITNQYGEKQRIRLAYIDAPELQQAHGKNSRDALSNLILHQKVQIEVFDTDQYKRKVARINLNGRDINLTQIQNGNAWHYQSIARKHQNQNDYRQYQQAQSSAQQQKYGLWQQHNPDAPWSYRYRTKQKENSGISSWF